MKDERTTERLIAAVIVHIGASVALYSAAWHFGGWYGICGALAIVQLCGRTAK